MLRLLTDENAHGHIVWGLLRRSCLGLDLVRVQDVELMERHDRGVLEWVAQHDRVILTDDSATMTKFATDRMEDGHRMPGLVVLRDHGSISDAIESILLIAEAGDHQEWANRIEYIPFRW